MECLFCLIAVLAADRDSWAAGDFVRQLQVGGRQRSCLIHIPESYDPETPTSVVLVLHGAYMDAEVIREITGLNSKADEAGFIVVYPNGTGPGRYKTWNIGNPTGFEPWWKPDDVTFIREVVEDVAEHTNVDSNRVFATGYSNGGFMCYRLAAELSDRIAAISPVAATMALSDPFPGRPVSVLHFHGTEDPLIPVGTTSFRLRFLAFETVDDTLAIWRELNACPAAAVITGFPDLAKDGTTCQRVYYGPGEQQSEVTLIRIEGGGHTWPGQPSPSAWFGRSTKDISANDLMWAFFLAHPLDSSAQDSP